MISEDILQKYGAKINTFNKGDFLFYKGDTARFYYQIISGELKMNNYNEKGKEFVQGIFKAGQSFGEPPLFIDEVYPANGEVCKDAEILMLSKSKFLDLLKENPPISLKFTTIFAKRLFYKSLIAVEMSSEIPEHRILSLLDYFKNQTQKERTKDARMKFDITRQEIANLTGLRVETVIRAVKDLERKNEISIVNKKIVR